MIFCPWNEIKRYESVIPHLQEALELVANLTDLTPRTCPLPHGKVMIQHGTTHDLESAKAEAHKKFLDIQYVLEGHEYCGWAPTESLTASEAFNEEKDCGLYIGATVPFRIDAGMCYVLYPEDAHKPCTHLDTPSEYTKLVIKLEL